ncbi:uncharacterized protein [Ptychodera flava]|uniref:uncharacterized protein n=1 Tax=Ptychodera flava TaxID=63121 RepID=UPI00396A7E76
MKSRMGDSAIASYKSSRLQKAKRINELERYKLEEQLRIIDKSRKTIIEMCNNDIRLLQNDFVNIQLSSGISPEGRPPRKEDKVLRSGQIVVYPFYNPFGSREKRRKRPASAKNGSTGERFEKRPMSCPLGRRHHDHHTSESFRVNSGRGLARQKLRETDFHVKVPDDFQVRVDRNEKRRPQTAPVRRPKLKEAKERPATEHIVKRHIEETTFCDIKIDVTENASEKLPDSDERENTSKTDGETEQKEEIKDSDTALPEVETNAEVEARAQSAPTNVNKTRRSSALLIVSANDLDEDDERLPKEMTSSSLHPFMPPQIWTTSKKKNPGERKFRDPRTLLLREESRSDLFSKVGEEELTKALARHLSRKTQEDPTTPTHASRQRSIGGYTREKVRHTIRAVEGSVDRATDTRRKRVTFA